MTTPHPASPQLSCLMSIYLGTQAQQLKLTLDSLAAQTRPADEIVLVEDGPISPEVQQLVAEFKQQHPQLRSVVLAENGGLGRALAAGLATIEKDYVARIDSDDVAFPQRFEKQLAFFSSQPANTAAVGTPVAEFEHTPGDRDTIRRLPESAAECARYVKLNSPLNHPSVMMRTKLIKEVGGYQPVHQMEDYDLWARLISAGYQLVNMPEALTYFRVDDAQFARRTGKGMFAAEKQMQRNLVSYGLVSRPRALLNLMLRSAYRMLPRGILRRAYGRLFHRRQHSQLT